MSKGAVTCFGVELSQRLAGTGVVVNCVNPELTKSGLPKEAALSIRLLFAAFGQSPEKTKNYGIQVACDDEFGATSGRYLRKGIEKVIPQLYLDAGVRARLWTESSRLVGLS